MRKRLLSLVLCLAILMTGLVFTPAAYAEEGKNTEIIIDNTDEGFSKTGSWGTSRSRKGYYGDNYFSISQYTESEEATATWSANISQTGFYDIYIWHADAEDDNSVSDQAPYTIQYSEGEVTSVISQQTVGGEWEYLASYPFQAGSEGKVTLTFDAEADSGALMADAVKFVLAEEIRSPESIIVDDSEAVFVDSKWTSSTYREGYYGNGYHSIAQNRAENVDTASATWNLDVENSGCYKVSVFHPEGGGDSSISDNAPYTIRHARGESLVRLNQRESGQGGRWRDLGSYWFNAGEENSIELNFNGVEKSKAIMADAVKLERIQDIVVDDSEFSLTGNAETEWDTVSYNNAQSGSYSTMQAGDADSKFSRRFYITTNGGYQLSFYKPAGLDVSQMSQNMVVNIDNNSYSIDLTSLKDGYNTVAFCSLDLGKAHNIEFVRAQDAKIFLDAVSLEYVGYSLYYTEFSDSTDSQWNLSGDWEINDNSLEGAGGEAYLSGEGWNNIKADFTFTTDSAGKFGLIVGGTREEGYTRFEYDIEDKTFKLLSSTGEVLETSEPYVLENGKAYTLQLLTEIPNLTFYLDGIQVLQMEGERSGNLGFYSEGAAISVSTVGIDTARGALKGTYTMRHDDPQQIIWGLGIEVQSDSIGSGNNGLPEETNSVPHDLTQSERDRLYNDMLKGFRYLRLATGLYYRGTDEQQKHLRERWPTQNEELAELIEKSGIEGVDWEYWSPTPYFKSTDSYLGGRLKCFSTPYYTFTGDKQAFLEDFANTIKEDIAYLNENGIPVIQYGLQNEPLNGTDAPTTNGYSTCLYNNEQYYETMKVVIPILKEAYPDLHIHADSYSGQYGRGSALIKQDPELLDMIDAWTFHRIGADSNDQIDRADYYNSNKGRDDIVVYNNEFEYLDQYTNDRRCINTAQSIMNWMTFENSPTWHWLHMLKPLGNAEASGYSLGFWRKLGDDSTYNNQYNDLGQGEWDYNYQNWNSIRGFLKYMPWDSQRYTVDEDVVRYDQRIMAWKTPEGKLVFALTNRSEDDYFQFNIDTGLDTTFHGYRYTPQGHDEIVLESQEGATIQPMLPPLSIEFWVQEEDETMVMANGITLDKTELNLAVGGEGSLTATVLPENAANKNVRWTSDDSAVAKVDENGKVTGVKEGETKIVATAISGSGQFEAECTVVVKGTSAVDRTGLQELYDLHKDKLKGNYTDDSWNLFLDALAGAEKVLADETATQEQIDEAESALQKALDGLMENTVNKSTLEYVLGIANGHVEAGDVDKLVPSAQEVFNKVLASAQAIYDDPDATQEQVDTAWKTLMYAIQAMGFVPGDKTELIDLVAEAKALDLNGYEDGAEKDAFTTALKAAEDLIADPDAMELDIDAAYDALNDAMQNLIPKPAAGDKTELKKVIDEADVKNSELDRYVDDAEAKQKFADALAAAKEVYEKDGATQEEIDQAKNNLLDAMTGLRLRADKDNLNKWLEDLKSIDLSQYTEESAAVVRAVIAKAEALAAQDLDEDDQDLINAMVAEMTIAKAQLVPAPADPEDPENPNPGDGSGESSNSDTSKPNSDASSQNGTNSEGKEATDAVPTTGDATPIAGLSLLAVAAAGTLLLLKKRKS